MSESLQQLLPEEKFLLSLCRLYLSDEQKTEIRTLANDVNDRDYFVDLSNKHGVIALCWYNLNETGNSDKVPDEHPGIIHSGYLKS
jgi:hypothetical protein